MVSMGDQLWLALPLANVITLPKTHAWPVIVSILNGAVIVWLFPAVASLLIIAVVNSEETIKNRPTGPLDCANTGRDSLS